MEKNIYPPLDQYSEQELDTLIQKIQRERQDRVTRELMATADDIVKSLETFAKYKTHIEVEAVVDGLVDFIDIALSDLITAFEQAGDKLS